MGRHLRRLGAAAAVALLLVNGCAGDAGPGGGEMRDPATAPSSKPSGTSPAGKAIPLLRMADSGSELELTVGKTANVSLSRTEYDWAEPAVDGAAVTISEDVSDEGSTTRSWTITAVAPGEATIGVAGSPPCRVTTPPCGAADVLWSVRITVL